MLQPLLQHETGQMAHGYFSYRAQLIQRTFMWHRGRLNKQRWAGLGHSPRDGCDSGDQISWQRSGGSKLQAALTQGWMERSPLRQPPLAHGGDVDTVLVSRHGIRPVPLDGGSPEHWEGKRDSVGAPVAQLCP